MIRRNVLVMFVVGVFASVPTAVAQTGACCLPDGSCEILSATECDDPNVAGAYQGDGVTCEAANCDERCDPECDWCWFDTIAENNCPADWNGTDDGCDCGCQFDDPDCDEPNDACVADFSVTAPYTSPSSSTCGAGNDCSLRSTEEHIYQVTIPSSGQWTVSLCGSVYDTYLYIGTTCCGAEVGSNDDGCGLQSEITTELSAGTYYVAVEGYSSCGTYVLDVSQEGTPGDGDGACCFEDNSCEVLTATECADEGGAYQGDGVTCAAADCEGRCDPQCDYCWVGTPIENNCPDDWNGTDDGCDCGCQFDDPDCGYVDGSTGACCFADNYCEVLTEDECYDEVGAYQGDGVTCAEVDCEGRCPSGCDWCWTDTIAENNCPDDWNGTDDGCDCGCQFDDPDCDGITTDGSTGACCFANGWCDEVTESECQSLGGSYQGNGTSCGQVDCSLPPDCGANSCGPGMLSAVPLSLLGLGATKFGLARRRRRGSSHRRF